MFVSGTSPTNLTRLLFKMASPRSAPEVDLSTCTLKDNFKEFGLCNILSDNDMWKFNDAIAALKRQFKCMPSCTHPFFCCYYLIVMMRRSYIPPELKGKMSSVVKELAPVAKSLAEAERLPLCPELSQDLSGNTYLSLRDVGRLVINKIFPNSRGTFTQHALIHEIGGRVASAVRSQSGRGSIDRVTIRRYDGSTFTANRYLESHYPVIFKTIHDWMMTWKDNHTEVEKYVSFL